MWSTKAARNYCLLNGDTPLDLIPRSLVEAKAICSTTREVTNSEPQHSRVTL